jgi:uncharacterized membrane protein HdeD (DUF308 family)
VTLRVAKIRALLGIIFALLGVAVAVQLLLRPGAMNQKTLGLAFAAVLIALGVVRVRVYLKIKSELGP